LRLSGNKERTEGIARMVFNLALKVRKYIAKILWSLFAARNK
jgi:hypothetical protein